MNKPYHITIGGSLKAKERKTIQAFIDQTFAEFHSTFDPCNPNSELFRLNSAPKETLIPLSPPLQDLLCFCSQIVALSGGRFDPTIEPLSKLWSEALAKNAKPSTQSLQAACDCVGWSHISLHNGICKKDQDNVRLDLGAIAKGLAIDWLVERLQAIGYQNLIVEWEGEIRAIGHHPKNRDWLVPINPALLKDKKPMAPIPLRNCAIATSGRNDQQIIDPQTAAPLERTEFAVAYATVIAPNCALASALSTAALLFSCRKEAENWAQEVVELYPEVRFWILSYQ